MKKGHELRCQEPAAVRGRASGPGFLLAGWRFILALWDNGAVNSVPPQHSMVRVEWGRLPDDEEQGPAQEHDRRR